MTLALQQRTLKNVLAAKAAANGERTFLRFGETSFSYRQAQELSSALARGLHAAGIRHGQQVAVMLENRPEVLWLHFALAMIGAVTVPVNNAAKGELLAYYLRQSDATALVVEDAYVERCAAVHADCPALGLVVTLPSDPETYRYLGLPPPGPAQDPAAGAFEGARVLRYRAVAQGDEPEGGWPEVRYSDIVHILYSSGTTGPSKGSMVANATALAVAMKYAEVNRYTRDDVLYTCLPLFHGNAMNCTVLPALLADAQVALSRRFSASQFWSEVSRFGATQFSLLSAMTNILWQQPPSPLDRQHRARLCQVVPTPPFFHEFEQRYGVRITSLYSLSDYGLASMFGPDAPREKWRSAGRVLAEMAVAILDDDDLPVPIGQVGQICLRANEPWFARQGYYRMAEAFTQACRNLWFHTGDRGYLDEDGYLYFVDRMKEVIRRRGENISAVEVENVIAGHPAVAQVAVFPVPSEFSEDEVMAAVVRRPGASVDEAQLIRHCEPSMAYFMVPRYVEFVSELPMTPTGKIEKYKLRDGALGRLSQVWDREKEGVALRR